MDILKLKSWVLHTELSLKTLFHCRHFTHFFCFYSWQNLYDIYWIPCT